MLPLSAARMLCRASAGVVVVAALGLPLGAAERVDPKYREASYAVNEALQREIYGLEGDRQQLLSAAAEASPEYAPARWHQGYLKDARRGWLKFDDVLSTPKAANMLAKYERERAAAADTVGGQLRLAEWCMENDHLDQARAHLNRVIELDPDHAPARQRLGFVREGGSWISRQEVTREREARKEREAALTKWRPVIEDLKKGLEHRSLQKREFSAQKLREIRDSAAIGAIEVVFRGADDDVVLPALDALSGMSDPEASLAIARFAVQGKTAIGRTDAAKRLAGRDPDSYVPTMLASLYSPVVSRFAALSLPSGRIGYRHVFVREGQDERQVRVIDTEFQNAGGDGNAAAAIALTSAAQTARQREAAAAAQNRLTAELNERLMAALATATGANLPAQPEAWWEWWYEQNEVFVQGSKQNNVIQTSNRVAVASPIPTGQPIGTLDCLAAGTLVWTAKGQVAIDLIRVGDLVLAQHAETGELAYKPVLRTTIRPQGELIKVTAESESFQTSGGHLFWVSGEGWVKSRNLKSGQVLHTARGPLHVTEVEAGSVAQTYNLVVADFSTYFVGQQMILSHDNTVRTPTRALVPGLAAE
jgi:tetratricopeptide (TPR) repeat protein